MVAAILSSLKSATTGDFIYSSMSFFASQRGGKLPGLWFVEALGEIGIDEQAVRQTLFRLERSGVLISTREGRQKWYRASPATEQIMSAGRQRVSEPVEKEWDGQWSLVHFRVGEDDREQRNRLRDVLLVEGFGLLGPGLYIHARDRTARVITSAKELGLSDRVNVFRGPHVAGPEAKRLVHDLWDLAAIAARYRKFLRRFEPVAIRRPAAFTPREAFGLRFAFMFEFFRITWDDPALPSSLLPHDWPAERARRVADKLMRGLLPGAVEFADQVLSEKAGLATV